MQYQQDKTFTLKQGDLKHQWFILDASGKTLGRFAAEVAKILRGKHRAQFTPHLDCGDGVIILNAEKIKVTGSKEAQKIYYRYTGYPRGRALREIPYRVMKDRNPCEILERAVKGMMPKTRLSNAQLKRLRIFADETHSMEAQQPVTLNI